MVRWTLSTNRAVARVWLGGSGRADRRTSFPVADPALAAELSDAGADLVASAPAVEIAPVSKLRGDAAVSITLLGQPGRHAPLPARVVRRSSRRSRWNSSTAAPGRRRGVARTASFDFIECSHNRRLATPRPASSHPMSTRESIKGESGLITPAPGGSPISASSLSRGSSQFTNSPHGYPSQSNMTSASAGVALMARNCFPVRLMYSSKARSSCIRSLNSSK